MTIRNPSPGAPLARNLERKVEVTAARLASISNMLDRDGVDRHDRQVQLDTYYTVPAGRLKVRTIRSEVAPPRAELIGYRRGDVVGSRWSDYQIMPLDMEQAKALVSLLGRVMGVWVQVRKRRDIYLIGATRVHLDTVDLLGAFVELETVITNQSQGDAEREHNDIITRLSLDGLAPIAGSYSDLLASMRETSS